jgi:hypothetical protein
MITRNSPLPILRRVCKLSRRQLVLARISNPLILSNTFALYISSSASSLIPLTRAQPSPNPKTSRYLKFAKTQTQTHTHKSPKYKNTERFKPLPEHHRYKPTSSCPHPPNSETRAPSAEKQDHTPRETRRRRPR